MPDTTLAASVLKLADPAFVPTTVAPLDPEWFPAALLPEIQDYSQGKLDSMREMVEAMSHEDDAEELYHSLALLWLELKFEWTRYNQVMNYQVMSRGTAEPLVFAKGAVSSAYVGLLENVLDPADLEQLTELSAAPLEFGKPDLGHLRDYIHQQEDRARAALREASATLGMVSELRFDDQQHELDSAAQQLARLEAATHELATASMSFLWPLLEDAVTRTVARPGWRYALALRSPPEVAVDLRLQGRMQQCLAEATRMLLHHDTAPTVEARMANHRSAQVKVDVWVTTPGRGRVELRVRADTAGRLRLPLPADAQEDWDVLTGLTSGAGLLASSEGTIIGMQLFAEAERAAS